jgi:hypothetical protein
MKISLFAVCFIGAAFFTLSETSHAAPFAGGFHAGGVPAGRIGGSVPGGHRIFMARGMRAGSAFRHGDRFFFHQRHRFFPGSNVAVYGYPGWYPNYYDWYPDYSDFYPDDYSGNDNESYQPGYDYEYWRDLALREQAELARRANYNASIGPMINPSRPQPVSPSNPGTLYNSRGGQVQENKSVVHAPDEPTPVPADPPTPVTPPARQTQGGVFDRLVLVRWLNDAGKDVIFVRNTQTNEVQKITSEPNEHHFRIVEIRPNADPKLFEAVISDGSKQGPVKFPYATAVKALINSEN